MLYFIISLLLMVQVSFGDILSPQNGSCVSLTHRDKMESYTLPSSSIVSDYEFGMAATTIGGAGRVLPTRGVYLSQSFIYKFIRFITL